MRGMWIATAALAAAIAASACERGSATLVIWGDDSTIGARVAIDGRAAGVLERDSTAAYAVLLRSSRSAQPEWRWPVETQGDTLFASGVPSAGFRVRSRLGRHHVEIVAPDGARLAKDVEVRSPGAGLLASFRYRHLETIAAR